MDETSDAMTEEEIEAIDARFVINRPLPNASQRDALIADLIRDNALLIAEIRRLQRFRRFWIRIENQRPAKDKS